MSLSIVSQAHYNYLIAADTGESCVRRTAVRAYLSYESSLGEGGYLRLTIAQFVQFLGTAITQDVLSRGQKAMKRLLEFFGSWRPVFGQDPYTGAPTVSISIEPSQSTVSLKTIFDYLNLSKREVYIAIDEFQQITKYPENGIEALLRSYIQFVLNAHFVFSGSKRSLMSQIFNSPERPFYQSTVSMGLEPLNEEIYYDFARRFFEGKKGCISQEIFHHIYQLFDGVTRNIQLMLNRLYETEK